MRAVARPVSFWPITEKRLCSHLRGRTGSFCSTKAFLLTSLAGQTEGSEAHCERPTLPWILSKVTGGVDMVRFRRISGVWSRLLVLTIPSFGVRVTIRKSLRTPTSMLHRFELCEPITWVGDARYGLGWGSQLGSFVLHPDRGSEGDSCKARQCKGKAHTS